MITQKIRNQEIFPLSSIYSEESLPRWKRTIHRIIRKIRGTYIGYSKLLKQEQVKVIHAHFGQEGYRCLETRRVSSVPMITAFYGMDLSVLPKQRIWKKRFKRLFKEGDLFLAEGNYMKAGLVELGCPSDRICVHRLGVDLDRISFVPIEVRETEIPVILICAAFREKKGIPYGLRAFHRILDVHPKAVIRIIGDGPLRAQIEFEIRQLNLGNRVTLLGFQPRSVCKKEIGEATLLLYPSVTASNGDTEGGAPVVLIEAMASGLPVVSSLHADIPEVVLDRRCGLLVEERDIDGLAKGLDELLKSPKVREEMGRAGRFHVGSNHNLQVQGEKLELIYDKMISRT